MRQLLKAQFSGRVQGVGFRYTVKSLAHGYEVTGTVENLPDGRVEMVVEGSRAELDAFVAAIHDSEVGRFIKNMDAFWGPATGQLRGFEIVG